MALEISKTSEGYIKVIERLISFEYTKVKIILYDLNNNQKKVNDNDWYNMDENTRDWVIKYYLPKVE